MPRPARSRPPRHRHLALIALAVIGAAAIIRPLLAASFAQAEQSEAPGAAAPAPAPPASEPSAPAAPAPTAAPEGQPAGETPPKAAAKVIDRTEIQGVLGRQVLSRTGEDMGRIVEVIVDRNAGHPRAVIIDFGGFLGVGSRKIAVDWNVLQFSSEQGTERVTLDLTRDQVKAAPEYKEGRPLVVLTRPPAQPAPQ